MKKYAYFTGIVFILLSVIEIVSLAFWGESLHKYIKSFLVPSLCATALLLLLDAKSDFKTVCFFVSAMVMHTIGDIFLLFPGMNWFMAGLGAFLLGHIFYLLIFVKFIAGIRQSSLIFCILIPVIIVAFFITMLFNLQGELMLLAVRIYASILLLMTSFGIYGMIKKYPYSTNLVVGAVLFIISDFIIALNSFSGIDFLFRHVVVMITYLLAEVLLVSAVVLPVINRKIVRR